MTEAARRVKRLSIGAPTEALAHRAALLIEDGLRVATMPPAARSGHLLVRTLRIPGIRANESSIRVAGQIERALSRSLLTAVPLDDPRADGAPAVHVRDALEPFLLAIARLDAGQPLAGWAWRLLFKWERAPSDKARILVVIVERAVEVLIEAPLVARVVAEIARRGLGRTLLAAASEDEARGWLSKLAWNERGRADAVGERVVEATLRAKREQLAAVMTPAHRAALEAVGVPASDGARALFWVAMALLARSPATPLATVLSMAGVVLSPAAIEEARERGGTESASAVVPVAPSPRERAELIAVEAGRASPAPEPTPRPAPRSEEAAALVDRPARPREAESLLAREGTLDGELTKIGGLWFLLPVLARLGLPAWVASSFERADAELPARVLARVAERFVADDPALDALATRVAAALPVPEGDSLPPVAQSLLAMGPPVRALPLVDAWVVALRRYLRRAARVGLRRVVARPARVAFTRTHIDVFLRLDTVDLAVRRAGLDIDPGWLAWFGRVVAFHYR